MKIIYPYITMLWDFYRLNHNQLVKIWESKEEAEPEDFQALWNEFRREWSGCPHEFSPHMLETVRAYLGGLKPDDLIHHNNKVTSDHESEYTGVAYFIEKFLGEGTVDMVRGMVEDVGENPEKAVELLDWVADSWPEWKKKIEPVVKKYQPIVRDMTETAAEAIAPIVDMPAVLLLGMSLRDEIKEQREFRADFKNMVNKVSEHFETKTEHIKSPEELELE